MRNLCQKKNQGLHLKLFLFWFCWIINVVVHYDLREHSRNSTLDWINESLRSTYPDLVNRKKGVIPQQNNARGLSVKLTQVKIKWFRWDIISYLPYLPDLALRELHLFLTLEQSEANVLKTDFQNISWNNTDFFLTYSWQSTLMLRCTLWKWWWLHLLYALNKFKLYLRLCKTWYIS